MAALLPRISRTDAFDADLKCLLGCDPAVLAHVHTQPDCVSADWLCDQASGIWHCRPNWRGKCKPPLATLEYIRYLDTIAHEQPMLLLAHLYTQESALLAGGQMIRCTLCWHRAVILHPILRYRLGFGTISCTFEFGSTWCTIGAWQERQCSCRMDVAPMCLTSQKRYAKATNVVGPCKCLCRY